MKIQISTLAMVAVLCCASTADAQRMQDRGRRGGPGDRPPPPGMGERNVDSTDNQQRFANRSGINQNGNRSMPSVQQLAQMMIANFDADGSSELSAAELQNALAALRQMMRNQGSGSNQTGPQSNALANRQNTVQNRLNFQSDQRQGNRPPPPRGQGNARRGR